jgi:hypothetical protein
VLARYDKGELLRVGYFERAGVFFVLYFSLRRRPEVRIHLLTARGEKGDKGETKNCCKNQALHSITSRPTARFN